MRHECIKAPLNKGSCLRSRLRGCETERKYNERTRATLNPTKYEKIRDAICGAIMMLATALFFVLGFVFDYWSVCWVTFLVGGIMCGIVSVIFKAIDRND